MPKRKKQARRPKSSQQVEPNKGLVIHLDADAQNADWLHQRRKNKRPVTRTRKPEPGNT